MTSMLERFTDSQPDREPALATATSATDAPLAGAVTSTDAPPTGAVTNPTTSPTDKALKPCVGVIALAEVRHDGLYRPVSPEASRAASERAARSLRPGEFVEIDAHGDLVVHLQDSSRPFARRRIMTMTRAAVAYEVATDSGPVTLEAGAGIVLRRSPDSVVTAREAALAGLEHRDLVPRPDLANGRILRRWSRPSTLANAGQVAAAALLAWVVPFLVLVGFYQVGLDISTVVYAGTVAILLAMAAMQWAETIKAIAPVPLPPTPDEPAPPASAVIAAYLPNEAETIVETLEVFLGLEYSGDLQVVLAYNTPRDLPVEDELRALAERDPRLLLVRVPNSRSKSQNINHVLPLLTGEFVGIFDADHHPAAGAFERAWRWIGTGADVVQGHCVVRNGAESGVAGLVATEFEQIYAVSHPGRQRLHGFGVFGGSNGFWSRHALMETRFRTDFLTEDIEASIRAVRDGRRIVNDPGLLSRELAPTTMGALWKQRMRWAQGWLQVSVRHGHGVYAPGPLGTRQRVGLGFLLMWRELFPWFSSLMWPLLAFFAWRDGGLSLGWTLAWLTTLLTVSTGPVQVLIARRLSTPEIRERTGWWWRYGLVSLAYAEWKNLIARVAQLKQLMGEHEWVVTARTPAPTTSPRA